MKKGIILPGIFGKILSKVYPKPKDPKDDHNYDHKPGQGDIDIAEGANKANKMLKEKRLKAAGTPPVNHQIAHKHSDGSKHGYVDPPGKMNSPLNSYANPRFVDTESGQKEEIAASKIMLDGAIKKFNEPSRKAVRQAKRSKRIEKRATSKGERLIKRADARDKRSDNKSDIRTYPSGSTRVLRSGDTYDNFMDKTAKIRAKAGTKKTELEAKAKVMQSKSDANKMIAEEKAKYSGMTQNQIYLQKEREKKNNNTTSDMFSGYRKYK